MSSIGKGSACPARFRIMTEIHEAAGLITADQLSSSFSAGGNNNMQHTFDGPVHLTINPFGGSKQGIGQIQVNVDVNDLRGQSSTPTTNCVASNCPSGPSNSQNFSIPNSNFNPFTLPTLGQFCDRNSICPPLKCVPNSEPPKDACSQIPVNRVDPCPASDTSPTPQHDRGGLPSWFCGLPHPNNNQVPVNNAQTYVNNNEPSSQYPMPSSQPKLNPCHEFLNPPPPACRPPAIFGPLVSSNPNCPMPPGQYVLVHPCCLCCMEKSNSKTVKPKVQHEKGKGKSNKGGNVRSKKNTKGKGKKKRQKAKHNSSPEPPNVANPPRLKQLRQLFIDQHKINNWGNHEDWSYLDRMDNGLSYMHSVVSSENSDESDSDYESVKDGVFTPLFSPQVIRRAQSFSRNSTTNHGASKPKSLNREYKRESSYNRSLLRDLTAHRCETDEE